MNGQIISHLALKFQRSVIMMPLCRDKEDDDSDCTVLECVYKLYTRNCVVLSSSHKAMESCGYLCKCLDDPGATSFKISSRTKKEHSRSAWDQSNAYTQNCSIDMGQSPPLKSSGGDENVSSLHMNPWRGHIFLWVIFASCWEKREKSWRTTKSSR